MIEHSKNLGEVIKNSDYLDSKLAIARCKLEIDVAKELIRTGMFAPTGYDIKRHGKERAGNKTLTVR